MRLALVAPDCNQRDGQARYVSEMALYASARGYDVDVFSVGFEETDGQGIRHRPVAAPRDAVRLRFFAFLVAASRLLARERFEIVHALGASCWRADVVTMQFCQAAWHEVVSSGTRGALRGGGGDRLVRRVIAAIEGRLLRSARVRAVAAVSARVGADIGRFYRRHDGVAVIPNGVDLQRFHPRLREDRASVLHRLGVPGDALVALFMGEFERKNLGAVLAAVAAVADPRLVLLAVGGSEPAPFRARARALGIADRVRFVGRTGEPERLMAAADVLVFPTLYEPFGMVPLEAAACGTPVIVSRCAGVAEWVEDGISGWPIDDPDDPRPIAARLQGLLSAPPAGMTARARRMAEQLSWQHVGAATVALYEGLREGIPPSSPDPPLKPGTASFDTCRLAGPVPMMARENRGRSR